MAVTVYINSKSEFNKMPSAAKAIARKPEVGRIIPMVFLTNSDATKALGYISYKTMTGKGVTVAVQDLKKSLPLKYQSGKSNESKSSARKTAKPVQSAANLATTFPTNIETWKSKNGKSINARAIRLNDNGEVTFQLASGKQKAVRVEMLSPSSQKRIKELASKASSN